MLDLKKKKASLWNMKGSFVCPSVLFYFPITILNSLFCLQIKMTTPQHPIPRMQQIRLHLRMLQHHPLIQMLQYRRPHRTHWQTVPQPQHKQQRFHKARIFKLPPRPRPLPPPQRVHLRWPLQRLHQQPLLQSL